MQLLGLGLYTFAEASRLVDVSSASLRRWIQGYQRTAQDEVHSHPPLWPSEIAGADVDGLTFRDLLEARFVRHFRALGVSLQTIRIAATNARAVLGSPYPFACRRFRSDGKTIFAEAIDASNDASLLDLRNRQYVLNRIIEPSLSRGLEFDDQERPARWFPVENSRAIVLDPRIAFGKPIVSDCGLRTDILYDAWRAEGENTPRVARLYDVPAQAVRAAIQFERRQAA